MSEKYDDLLWDLKKYGVLNDERIFEAFKKVRRKDFLLKEYCDIAHLDVPLSIGFGQTNSQPYTVAFMLDLLQPNYGDKILDIGSGSGWTTVLLADLVGSTGSVIGLEIIPELVEFGKNNLDKYNFSNAKIELAGEFIGKPGDKFDKILVSASSEKYPTKLLDQLNINGRLVIPVKDSIVLTEKVAEYDYKTEKYPGFMFVPLV